MLMLDQLTNAEDELLAREYLVIAQIENQAEQCCDQLRDAEDELLACDCLIIYR
jgi:hypothetical protein